MSKKFVLLIRSLFCGLLVLTFANPTSAAFVSFSDETLFNGAHSVPLTLESFEGFSTGDPAPIAATDFTLSTSNSSGEINAGFTGTFPTDGVNDFGWSYPDDASMTFSFASPQSVFSMDITDLASVGATTIDVFADGGLVPVVPTIDIGFFGSHGGLDFLGLVSDSQFSSLTFTFSASEWLGADRVQYGISPVPVPAAFWLFGTALIGFIGISRRRKVA
jgi:hypothetical protein